MKHTSWMALLLAGVGAFAAPGTARAQFQIKMRPARPPANKTYIHFEPEGDFSQILNARLLQLEVDKLRKQYGNQGLFPKVDQLLADHPGIKKLIDEELRKARNGPKIDPEKLKKDVLE